jgi:hypothetical protein
MMKKSWTAFLGVTLLLWLLAHAVALFSHEFSHSFVASLLGWKRNPLALNWGPPSPLNLLLQVDIDENVDYTPIFAQGHRLQAGIIALAGMGLGNALISLAAGLSLFAIAKRADRTILGMFAYWLVVMSIGNLISYVPLRVFTWHADMHTVEEGFGWTPGVLFIVLGVPILLSVLWFLLRFEPIALEALFPASVVRREVFVVLTSVSLFGWFSLSGLSGHGDLSHKLSVCFISVLLPLSIMTGLVLTRRGAISFTIRAVALPK